MLSPDRLKWRERYPPSLPLAAVILVSLTALLWLSGRVIAQDRPLERPRQLERCDVAAGDAAAVLGRALTELERTAADAAAGHDVRLEAEGVVLMVFNGTGVRLQSPRSSASFSVHSVDRGRIELGDSRLSPSLLPRPVVEPDVHPRCFPVVGLVQQVEVAVAVQVGEPGLMPAVSSYQLGLAEVAAPVAIEYPGSGIGMIGLRVFLSPLGHLGNEDVEMPIPIDVAELEAVTVHHIAVEQFVGLPVRRGLRVAGAFIPAHEPARIAGGDDDLRVFAGFELAGKDQSAAQGKLDPLELLAAGVLEP